MSDFNNSFGKNNCNEFRELFSPWLDNEISGEERDLLAGHLLKCDSCRAELDFWKRISVTLKGDIVSGEPSPGFCTGVMSRVREEIHHNEEIRTKPGGRLLHFWRGPAAAAAAAVMLFAGSWGVHVAFKSEKPVAVVMDQGQPGIYEVKGQNTPAEPDKAVQPDSQAAVEKAIPEPTANDTGKLTGVDNPIQPVTPKPGNQVMDAVLLNSHRDILSTILKVTTPNVADNTNNALEMASRLGGTGQVLTSQKRSSGELAIVRIAVPRENGRKLVTQLSGLGGIIDRVDEKRDVTASYTEARNRLSEIQTRSSNAAPEYRSQLEAEASGLKRQIESWDKELGSYAIILWLEQ